MNYNIIQQQQQRRTTREEEHPVFQPFLNPKEVTQQEFHLYLKDSENLANLLDRVMNSRSSIMSFDVRNRKQFLKLSSSPDLEISQAHFALYVMESKLRLTKACPDPKILSSKIEPVHHQPRQPRQDLGVGFVEEDRRFRERADPNSSNLVMIQQHHHHSNNNDLPYPPLKVKEEEEIMARDRLVEPANYSVIGLKSPFVKEEEEEGKKREETNQEEDPNKKKKNFDIEEEDDDDDDLVYSHDNSQQEKRIQRKKNNEKNMSFEISDTPQQRVIEEEEVVQEGGGEVMKPIDNNANEKEILNNLSPVVAPIFQEGDSDLLFGVQNESILQKQIDKQQQIVGTLNLDEEMVEESHNPNSSFIRKYLTSNNNQNNLNIPNNNQNTQNQTPHLNRHLHHSHQNPARAGFRRVFQFFLLPQVQVQLLSRMNFILSHLIIIQKKSGTSTLTGFLERIESELVQIISFGIHTRAIHHEDLYLFLEKIECWKFWRRTLADFHQMRIDLFGFHSRNNRNSDNPRLQKLNQSYLPWLILLKRSLLLVKQKEPLLSSMDINDIEFLNSCRFKVVNWLYNSEFNLVLWLLQFVFREYVPTSETKRQFLYLQGAPNTGKSFFLELLFQSKSFLNKPMSMSFFAPYAKGDYKLHTLIFDDPGQASGSHNKMNTDFFLRAAKVAGTGVQRRTRGVLGEEDKAIADDGEEEIVGVQQQQQQTITNDDDDDSCDDSLFFPIKYGQMNVLSGQICLVSNHGPEIMFEKDKLEPMLTRLNVVNFDKAGEFPLQAGAHRAKPVFEKPLFSEAAVGRRATNNQRIVWREEKEAAAADDDDNQNLYHQCWLKHYKTRFIRWIDQSKRKDFANNNLMLIEEEEFKEANTNGIKKKNKQGNFKDGNGEGDLMIIEEPSEVDQNIFRQTKERRKRISNNNNSEKKKLVNQQQEQGQYLNDHGQEVEDRIMEKDNKKNNATQQKENLLAKKVIEKPTKHSPLFPNTSKGDPFIPLGQRIAQRLAAPGPVGDLTDKNKKNKDNFSNLPRKGGESLSEMLSLNNSFQNNNSNSNLNNLSFSESWFSHQDSLKNSVPIKVSKVHDDRLNVKIIYYLLWMGIFDCIQEVILTDAHKNKAFLERMIPNSVFREMLVSASKQGIFLIDLLEGHRGGGDDDDGGEKQLKSFLFPSKQDKAREYDC